MVRSAKRLTLTLCTSLLIACGEQAQVVELAPMEKPAGHDTMAQAEPQPQGQRQVVVPEEIQGKYQTATMSYQLPGMAAAATIELSLGGGPQSGDYGSLQARDYLPAFLISGNTITSEGLEEKNPALWAEWQRDGKVIFSGWLFRDYPGLNPVQIPDHQLSFIGVK